MKYSISLFALLFVLSTSNAQDTACQRLISLQYAPRKKANRTVTTITSPQNRDSFIVISEWDTLRNAYFNQSMGRSKTERVIFDKKHYLRVNGREWKLFYSDAGKNEDSLRISARKIQNMPYNCQQLNDDILDGESCYVFTFEIERTSQSVQNMKSIPNISVPNSNILIKKEWYTKQGQLKKSEIKTKYSYGETIEVTTYERDISIPLIKEPLIKQK